MNIPCHAVSGFLGENGFGKNVKQKYARPLPRVYAIFLFAIEYSAKAQPPQHTTTGAGGGGGRPVVVG